MGHFFLTLHQLISRISEFNLPAQWHLNRLAGTTGMFVCRGRIQLSLCSDTIIKPADKICYIGIRLLGKSTLKNDTTIIDAGSKSIMDLNGCLIGRGVSLSVGSSAYLGIGNNSYINNNTRIFAQQSITIGQNCAISFGVTIFDDDGHGFGLPPYSAPIVIEDNVWIGCNVTILKGVTIGSGSVIAAGAVVNKSCSPNSLLAGVPARVVREGVRWTDKSRVDQSYLL